MSTHWCKGFLILSVFFIESFALFEDQVGKFDWKISLVGKIKFSNLDPKLHRVYVATESNIVAALNLKDGKILWRRLLENGVNGEVKELFVDNEIITISGNGPYMVRGWNKSTGLQTFEWSSPVSLPRDGHWTLDQNKIYQIGIFSNSLEAAAYHSKSGNPAGSVKTVTGPWISGDQRCAVSNAGVMCVSSKNKSTYLTFFNLTDSSMKSEPLNFEVESIKSLPFGCMLTLPNGASIVAFFNIRGILSTYDVPSGATVSLATIGSSQYLNVVSVVNGQFEVQFHEVTADKVSSYSVRHTNSFSLPDSSASSCTHTNYAISCFILVSGQDHSASLIYKGKVLWVREEALANIINVEMVDLPVSEQEAAIEKEFANKGGGILGMITRRLTSQVFQLKTALVTILGLKDSFSQPGERKDLVRDSFGLHKLILVVTSALKVFGMDNEKGEIIWQFHLPGLKPFTSLDKENVLLFLQRSARHLPHPTMASMLLKKEDTQETLVYTFNPINGQPLNGGLFPLGKHVVQCLLLPETNEEFIHGIVMLFDNGEVDVFPKSTISVALENANSLYMYTVDSTTSILTGYSFSSIQPENSPKNSVRTLVSTPIWSTDLRDKIIAAVGKRRGEKVHSQGRVLGDRSVLYKYINPNLVALATQTSDAVHKSVISMYLIDTVNGKIVFSIVHKRAAEPVHMVHSENWIVYSYFNDKARRTEIVTLDLYEGKTQKNTTAFSSLDPILEPLIGRQAYIFPHSITAMKETITEKGITSKHVLVGLGSGGVMEVPWALLDPRRAVTPTAEMREEGVLPYIPELALPPETIITYNHTLIKINGIHTSPAGLESTSLVFIYGLDLFYTRVSPSKTFDVLKDDFEYWLITAVLTGLITAAYVTKRLASRKALKQAWK